MTLSLQDVYAANILDTMRQPLLLLSADLRVVSANPAFYQMFHLRPAEARGRLVHELGGGEWRNAHLRELLEELFVSNAIDLGRVRDVLSRPEPRPAPSILTPGENR